MRRVWGSKFKPSEQFCFGWRRLTTQRVVIDSLSLGPWEFTLFRIDESDGPVDYEAEQLKEGTL